MALTDLEKKELDNAILGLSLEQYDSFTNRKVSELLESETGRCYSIASIVASILRICNNELYCLALEDITKTEDKVNKYRIKIIKCVVTGTSFVKNKNIISFAPSCVSKNNEDILTYDFITKKFNYDLRTEVAFQNLYPYAPIFSLFADAKMFENEWIFNYIDDLREIREFIRDCRYYRLDSSKMPQGMLKYFNDTNTDISEKEIIKYMSILKYGVAGANFIKNYGIEEYEVIEEYIGMKNLQKSLIASVKNLYVAKISSEIDSLFHILKIADENTLTQIRDMFDTNRDIGYNNKIIKKFVDSTKNVKIEENLRRLNFINNLEMGDFIIVVPQTMEDKAKEGQMQNNCVGYYYDDSIKKGNDFIYFIRKKENPNKSYITCRYNVRSNNTVEYRLKNNSPVRNNKELDMIYAISNIIREKLTK